MTEAACAPIKSHPARPRSTDQHAVKPGLPANPGVSAITAALKVVRTGVSILTTREARSIRSSRQASASPHSMDIIIAHDLEACSALSIRETREETGNMAQGNGRLADLDAADTRPL